MKTSAATAMPTALIRLFAANTVARLAAEALNRINAVRGTTYMPLKNASANQNSVNRTARRRRIKSKNPTGSVGVAYPTVRKYSIAKQTAMPMVLMGTNVVCATPFNSL